MINKILQKYDGYTNDWYPNVKEKTVYQSSNLEKYKKESDGLELKLRKKYKKYIPGGWYGFGVGSPTPPDWFKIIDKFLKYLLDLQQQGKISGFEIHQIKMKFGACRFYISYSCDDDELREFIELQIDKLERHLFDEKLIY